MPLLYCILQVVVIVVIAGVLVWALKALPLDATIQSIGRVAIIVIFVLVLMMTVLGCLGYGHYQLWPPLR